MEVEALENLRDKVGPAITTYRQMQKIMQGGCHDGYCVIEKTRGMHTNGGCGCLQNMTFQQRQYVGHMLKASQVIADYVDALIEQAKEGK